MKSQLTYTIIISTQRRPYDGRGKGKLEYLSGSKSRVAIFLAVLVSAGAICGPLYAEEENAAEKNKVQGVDLVTDAVAAVVTKAFAILSGNLEVTMPPDTDRIKNKDKYRLDAIGQTVPKATIAK